MNFDISSHMSFGLPGPLWTPFELTKWFSGVERWARCGCTNATCAQLAKQSKNINKYSPPNIFPEKSKLQKPVNDLVFEHGCCSFLVSVPKNKYRKETYSKTNVYIYIYVYNYNRFLYGYLVYMYNTNISNCQSFWSFFHAVRETLKNS